jgi:subtilisin family serine protease
MPIGGGPLEMVGLTRLMERSRGRPDVAVALIDGPVAADHPDLSVASIRAIPPGAEGRCTRAASQACGHGTFVAGMLCGRRGSAAQGICPDCSLLVRPIFAEAISSADLVPQATPEDLAQALVECVEAGARVINLSAAMVRPASGGRDRLREALDHAARRGVLVAAAAGNQGTLSGSPIVGHPWVIPVAACDARGRPLPESNLGNSIGRRGLLAPGEVVVGTGVDGRDWKLEGTSVAVPFVAGTLALLLSAAPGATAAAVRWSVLSPPPGRRASVVPPMLDAEAAYQHLCDLDPGRVCA